MLDLIWKLEKKIILLILFLNYWKLSLIKKNKTDVFPGSCPKYISNHHWVIFLYVFKAKTMNSKLACLSVHFYFYLEL